MVGGSGAKVSCSEPPPLDPSFKLSDAMSGLKKKDFRTRSKHRSCFRGGHTLAEVPEGVVALFREGDFVDRVSQVAMFQ